MSELAPQQPPPRSLPTIYDPTTLIRKGLCPVSTIRPQGPEALEGHSLYYEQHGKGTRHKVVFIMGMNSNSSAWEPQVNYFGRDGFEGNGWVVGKDKSGVGATILVFDNRGVGNSGYPRGPYTTSGMAEDLVCLLDEVGWTGKRELNIVGTSMGGMIAQELASRIPERIASLVLSVTTPGGQVWKNFPSMAGVQGLTRGLFATDPTAKAQIMMDMLYPVKWLGEKAEGDPQGRTNRVVQTEAFLRRISSTKPQELLGNISQMAAGLTHNVSPERLHHISSSIPKITIVTGDDDNLVDPVKSRRLKAAMPEAELVEWEETGHGINHQRPQKLHQLLERVWEEGKRRLEEDPERWGVA